MIRHIGKVLTILATVLMAGQGLAGAPVGYSCAVTTDNGWRYFKGTGEPAADWHTRNFDDSGWSQGSMPFWFGDGTNGTHLADMQNGYTTLYMRYTFTNYNAIAITSMVFSADYDDAFIVWLNDVEVYRTPNAPASPTHTSVATIDHESAAGGGTGGWVTNILVNPSEQYFIWPGFQKISVQAFNYTIGSSDFHMNLKVVANHCFVSNAIKVACVGSSTTQGHQNVPNSFHTSYPMFLQGLLGPGYEVRNYGHNGKTTIRNAICTNGFAPDSFADNPNTPGWYHSTNWQPDMVCIQLGVNDAHTNRLWDLNKHRYTNEYDYLVNSYTNHGGTPTRIYCGTPPWVATNYFAGSYIGNPDVSTGWDWNDDGHVSNLQVGPMVRSYAATRGHYLIDVAAFTEGHWPDWYNAGGVDALHMSTLGHSNVAVCVFDGMKCPAIQISGNDQWLAPGSATPSVGDGTDFGTAAVGGMVDRTFVITNFGATTLALTGSPRVVISGAQGGDYSLVTPPPTGVVAGGSASFTVRFAPGASGTRVAKVTVPNSDFTKPAFEFAVQGTGGAATASPGWTAYNDCAWQADDAADVTSPFTTNSPSAATNGVLRSEAGQTLPVSVNITTNAGQGPIGWFALGTNVFPWPVGTDAANEFQGRVGRGYTCEIGGTGVVVTVGFSGLTPARRYKLVVWSSRVSDGSNYSNRLSDVTLSGVSSFTNTSTVVDGVTRSAAQATTTLRATLKTGYGPVARFEQIDPGSDGQLTFTVRRNAASEGNAYLNAFKLVEAASIVDTDSDGMDDTWEQAQFGGLSAAGGGAAEDWDHDGFSNYGEYRAGTDPQAAGSRLEMNDAVPEAAGRLVLAWPGVAGRSYALQNTAALSGSWTTLHAGIPGVVPLNTYTVDMPVARGFWRVTVE